MSTTSSSSITGVETYDTPAGGVEVISLVRNLLRMLELPRWNLVFEGVNFAGSWSIPTSCSAALKTTKDKQNGIGFRKKFDKLLYFF